MRSWCLLTAMIAAISFPGSASADPVPFAGLVSAPGYAGLRLTLADTPSLSSADVPNFVSPADPVYGSSARVFVDDIPSDEGPFLGFFKLPEVEFLTSFNNGTTTFLVFGPGSFSIATLNPVNPLLLTPFVTATFANVVLGLQNDGSSQFAAGNAVFEGVAFDNSGLQNPGSFVFSLGQGALTQREDGRQFDYPIALGVTVGQPAAIPEPSTLFLVSMGLSGYAAHRRKAGRNRISRA